MRKGLFITFEGGDGSGKSTQIQRLISWLEERGYEVLVTREPGGTVISEAIRDLLLDPAHGEMTPVTEALLYAAARAQLVDQVIRPALDDGKIVICDRFLDSSIAYQSYGRELGGQVMDYNRHAAGECMPDLTFYLRVDPRVGRSRIADRARDRIEAESAAFHERVWEGYEALCRKYPGRILPIDAAASIREIADAIRAAVEDRLTGRRDSEGSTDPVDDPDLSGNPAKDTSGPGEPAKDTAGPEKPAGEGELR